MKPAFWFYMLLVVIGFLLVALPDNNNRVFSLSENHGPSFLDAAGLVLALVPWTIMGIVALLGWGKVLLALGRRLVTILLTAGIAGLMVVVVSVRSDSDFWMAGAAIAFVAQLVLIVAAFRKT
jgi:hypothetical protein